MNKKRVLALTMVLGITLTQTLTGCGKKEEKKTDTPKKSEASLSVNKTGLPIVNEKQKLKVLVVQGDPQVKASDTTIHKEIAEKTNVDIDWVEIQAAAWPEKKGLIIASNELPDVFMGNGEGKGILTDTELLNMAANKTIIPIDPLLKDYGPNFQKLAGIEKDLIPSITADDGHIYGLPYYIGIGDGTAPYILSTDQVSYINKKWLDTLGLEIPKTTADFEKVLLAFKTKDPNGNGKADEIPMTAVGPKLFNDWFGAFGRVNDSVHEFIGVKDGKAVFEAVQPEYKEAIKYFNKLSQQGLIDPEAFSQDSKVFNAKLKSPVRTVGVFESWRGTSWRLNDNDTEYVVLPPLEGPKGDRLWPKLYNGLSGRGAYVITASCKNPELAMRWGDNILEPDNAYQFWTGARIGYNIQKNDKGTFDLIKKMDATNLEHKKQIGTGFGFTCVDYLNEARKPVDTNPLNVDNEKIASDKFFKGTYPKERYPNVFFNVNESKTIQTKGVDILNYVKLNYAKWITKGGADAEWDAYIKQLDSMGLKEYLAQYQSALDRYNKTTAKK